MRNRTKKYPEGILQHKKDIGYNKTYYDSHSSVSRCETCGSPVLIRCLSRHKCPTAPTRTRAPHEGGKACLVQLFKNWN